MELIDLSRLIEDDMPVFPGDSKTALIQSKTLSAHGHTNFMFTTGMHAGTHIDSPMHMVESTQYISQYPLDSFIGPGCILDVRGQSVIEMKDEYENKIKDGSVVLLYTGNEDCYRSPKYFHKHPVVDLELGRFLVEKNIKILGMDMPSPDNYPFPVHKFLFNNGIYILENLCNLVKLLEVPKFEVIAFPLKIKADSSIVRAVARII